MERNSLSSFGRGSPKEPSCKSISKSMHWLRRSRLKIFLFLALAGILFNVAERVKEKSFKDFSIFSSGGHLGQRSGTV